MPKQTGYVFAGYTLTRPVPGGPTQPSAWILLRSSKNVNCNTVIYIYIYIYEILPNKEKYKLLLH